MGERPPTTGRYRCPREDGTSAGTGYRADLKEFRSVKSDPGLDADVLPWYAWCSVALKRMGRRWALGGSDVGGGRDEKGYLGATLALLAHSLRVARKGGGRCGGTLDDVRVRALACERYVRPLDVDVLLRVRP